MVYIIYFIIQILTVYECFLNLIIRKYKCSIVYMREHLCKVVSLHFPNDGHSIEVSH